MRTTTLLFAASFLAVASAAATEPPPRFALQGQLETAAPEKSDGRFSVRAALVPAAPRQDRQARFVLNAKLAGADKATCVIGDQIFRNGFEGS